MSPEIVYTGATLIVEGVIFEPPGNQTFDWSGLGMTARIVIEDRDNCIVAEKASPTVVSPSVGAVFVTFPWGETANWSPGVANVSVWLIDASGAKFLIKTFPLTIIKRA